MTILEVDEDDVDVALKQPTGKLPAAADENGKQTPMSKNKCLERLKQRQQVYLNFYEKEQVPLPSMNSFRRLVLSPLEGKL